MSRPVTACTRAGTSPNEPRPPELQLAALDTLWLQITGTLCNIACLHCFISCGPKNHQHEMMTVEQVRATLAEAYTQGVREYYFTGGEPFLHPNIKELITMALSQTCQKSYGERQSAE